MAIPEDSLTTITWLIEVDWTGAGVWVNEAARVVSLSLERGSAERFAPLPAGKAVLTFDNNDRRFDPWYVSSPLYPNVQPYRRVRIKTQHTGTVYPLFAGRIEDIEPTGGIGQRRVTVTAYDGLRDLAQADAAVALKTDIAIDQALGYVLDDAGWPAGAEYRDIDPSLEVMPYWWRDAEASAKDATTDLFLSEHGAFFMTAAGKARFVSRLGFTTGNAMHSLDEDHITDVQLVNPWQAVINDVRITCKPITLADLAVVWKLVDTNVYLAGGETTEVWAEYVDGAGRRAAATNVQTPAASVDYTANSSSAGAQVDLTASLAVTAQVYATWAKLTLENTGATGLYVTLCQLRGQALTQNPTTVRVQAAASQLTYGRRQLDLTTPWQQRVATASDLATGLVHNFSAPTPPVTVMLQHWLPNMLAYELFDRVTLTVPTYGIGRNMQVGRLAYRTGATMQDFVLEMVLLPAETQTAWMLAVVGKGELGVKTWLGY